MITVYKREGKEGSLRDLGKTSFWVDCVKPTNKELEEIAKRTSLSMEELKEYSDINEKSKLIKNKHWIIVYSGLSKSPRYISSHVIFILKNGIITFRREDDLFPDISELQDKIGNKFELLYNIIHKTTDKFFEELEFIEEEADRLEALALDKPDKSVVKRIFALRKKLVKAHKALNSNREVIQAIESERSRFFPQEFLRKLRFVYYDLVQLIDSKDTYREILSGSLDMYVSSVSNNLNNVMKTLTILTAILMVPTLISGIYGMNFKNMPEIYWKYGYLWSFALMLILIILLLWFFRRKGFLRALE